MTTRRWAWAAAGAAVLVIAAWLASSAIADPARPDAAATSGGTAPIPTSSPEPATTAPATSTPTPTAAAGETGAPRVAGERWRPQVGQTWQWQLAGELDLTVAADVYDLDAFTATAEQVATLHRAGRHVVCYVNAGAYEDFRPDHAGYPAEVLGHELSGWEGERWLDIRRWDLLEPILEHRLGLCRQKGFDGIEADNVDGYANDSGFPLTDADQLLFNRRLAEVAHKSDLAIGLKNDIEQATDLVSLMDFAVNEECAKYRECDALAVFIAAGKPVFHAEYELPPAAYCEQTRRLGFSSIRKHLELDAWREPCP